MTTITIPDNLHLASGAHDANDDGRYCLVEAWAYLRGLDWSDHPDCMSPVIAAFLRGWNDGLPDDQRTPMLARYLTQEFPVGTAEVEERRSYIALDWLIRTHLPAWLRAVPALVPHAEQIEAMPEIVDPDSAKVVGDLVRAAWDAAGDAAGAAAGDAARAAAWAAAGAAAWDAAGDAAGAAAGAAARAAAWDAAGDAAWAAARAAAGDALAPVVAALQESAHGCIAKMAAAVR